MKGTEHEINHLPQPTPNRTNQHLIGPANLVGCPVEPPTSALSCIGPRPVGYRACGFGVAFDRTWLSDAPNHDRNVVVEPVAEICVPGDPAPLVRLEWVVQVVGEVLRRPRQVSLIRRCRL